MAAVSEAVLVDDLEQCLINRDPEIVSGTPVFMGTRVPIKSLIEWAQGGTDLEYFSRNFPSVHQEQMIALLDLIKYRLNPVSEL